MEQTIKIEVPEGKKAVYDEYTQTIEFVDIEPIRSKSWEEFCKNNPAYTTNYTHINNISGIIARDLSCSEYDHLELNNKDAEGILALVQLTRLHDEWVGDWERKDKESVFTITRGMHNKPNMMYLLKRQLLEFPTEKMAAEFLDCFEDLIEKAKKFI